MIKPSTPRDDMGDESEGQRSGKGGSTTVTKPYRFLESGAISERDVRRIIRLTGEHKLEWVPQPEAQRAVAYPADQASKDSAEASAQTIGENLRGTRLEYDPVRRTWTRLRLTSHDKQEFFVEKSATAEVKAAVDALYYELHAIGVTDFEWLTGTGSFSQG